MAKYECQFLFNFENSSTHTCARSLALPRLAKTRQAKARRGWHGMAWFGMVYLRAII